MLLDAMVDGAVEVVVEMAGVVEVVVVVVVVVELGVDAVHPPLPANPRPVDAPRAWILLTLPLRILLAVAKPPLLLLLPLLVAAVPLPRPIGSETGGNSGLTVLIEVPGVTGVVGVGCTQLCCTPVLGSAAFNADDTVKVKLEVVVVVLVLVLLMVVLVLVLVVVVMIWPATDADVDNCTGG